MMQFIVFAAFAMVLSIPDPGVPWRTLDSPAWVWGGVIGQVLLALLVGLISTRLVRNELEREPAWPPAAQTRLARANLVIRGLLLVGIGFSLFGTDWARTVRGWSWTSRVWGLDEMIMLAPFFVATIAAWVGIYPADKAVRQVALEQRLWASVPARPVWGLRAFLSFMLRQNVLIIAVPMVPIVVANDFVHVYAWPIRRLAGGVLWADQAVLILIAGIVFFFAPVMLRFIWHTRRLPAGELRDRLEGLCRRIGLRYRRILVWESDGMVVNAAVMGLFAPVRYILLSDGLLEMMNDEQIEAVFGHEAGHVKHRHIEYYLLFAVLSMLIVGGLMELALWGMRTWPEEFTRIRDLQDYLQVTAMGLIVVIWALGFGAVSRRFEWQADLFGALSVTPPADRCSRPCFVHGTALGNEPDPPPRARPICATAASVFADALHRIAVLNGIPLEARSWRHSSIANRIRLLRNHGHDPFSVNRLQRTVMRLKASLIVGVALGMVIAVWLYWPQASTGPSGATAPPPVSTRT
jgi:STE24 endopeptidase